MDVVGEMQDQKNIEMEDWQSVYDMLYRFFRKRLRSESDAEDLTQEVLLKVHQHYHGQDAGQPSPDNPTQWVYRIARNALIDGYRRQNTATMAQDQLQAHTEQEAAPEANGQGKEDPLRQEVATWLGAFVKGLPPIYRDALTAVDIDGMSQKAYGASQGMSYSGVKSRVQRGRQMLKERLLACCQFAFDRRGSIIDVQAHHSSGGAPPGCCRSCGPSDPPTEQTA